jgi:hypothetical protein
VPFVITGFFCLFLFVLVAAWSVGFGRTEKVALFILIPCFLLMMLSSLVLAGRHGSDFMLPSTERWVLADQVVMGIGGFGAVLFFVGCCRRIWLERRRVFPFLYPRQDASLSDAGETFRTDDSAEDK